MKLSQNDILCLAILEKLEKFRCKLEAGEIQEGCADWVLRMCEANVADFTQFRTRADWEKALKEGRNYEKNQS